LTNKKGVFNMPTDQLLNRRVYIRITNKCNKDCSFCFYKNDPKQSTEISLETLKSIIRKEYAMHDKSTPLIVELTGGEPTLHTNYKALATYIANLAPGLIKLRFETNGTNLDDQEFLEFAKLFKQGHTRLKVSFNSELIDSDPQ
jgi:sulfatase maturation enzyme AslB (radical SAM superfamily)